MREVSFERGVVRGTKVFTAVRALHPAVAFRNIADGFVPSAFPVCDANNRRLLCL